MWHFLCKRLLIDWKQNHQQRNFMIVMFTLVIAISTLSVIAMRSLNTPYQYMMDRANGSHLIISANSATVATLDEQLAAVDGIEAAEQQLKKLIGNQPAIWIPSEEKWQSSGFSVYTDWQTELNIPQIVTGEPFVDHDGLWLSHSLAQEIDISTGEMIKFRVEEQQFELPILGTFFNTAQPHRWDVLLSSSIWAQIDDKQTFELTTYHIRLTEPETVQQKQQTIRSLLADDAVYGLIDFETIQFEFSLTNLIFLILILLSGIMGFLASAVILANIVSGTIIEEIKQIGILKTYGLTPRWITLMRLIQNWLIGLIACLLGIPLGIGLAMIILRPLMDQVGTALPPRVESSIIALIIGLVLLCITLFVLLPTWRAGRMPIISTTNTYANNQRTPWIVRLLQKIGAPPLWIMAGREAFAQPRRVWLTILTIIIGVVNLTSALGSSDAMNLIIHHPSQIGMFHDFATSGQNLSAESLAQLEETVSESSAVGAYYIQEGGDYSIIIAPDGELSETFIAQYINPNGLFDQYLTQGRWPTNATEIVMGNRWLENWSLTLGDQVETNDGYQLTIVGGFDPFSSRGNTILFDAETYFADQAPSTKYFRMVAANSLTATEAADQLQAELDTTADVWLSLNLPSDLDSLPTTMLAFSLLIISIGAMGIFNALWMNVRVRKPMYGVLKSIGYTPAQIRKIIIYASILLTGIGIAIGFPLGILYARTVMPLIGEWASFPGKVIIPIKWLQLGIVSLLTMILGTLGALIPGNHASLISVVDVLRD